MKGNKICLNNPWDETEFFREQMLNSKQGATGFPFINISNEATFEGTMDTLYG